MNLPWVSRARYTALKEIVEALRAERADLKATVDDLTAKLARVAEVANRVPRDVQRASREPIPLEVEAEIKAYSSPIIRRQLRYEARQARLEGESWDSIKKELANSRPTPTASN